MATMAEYIERLIYQFTSQGADQVASDMNKVAAAQTTTSTSALNLEKSFNALERRYDSSIRAAQDYAAVQAKVAAAVAQNPALQDRANNVLAQAEQRFAAAARGSSLYGQALNAGQAQMQAFAAQSGTFGSVLQAIGPAGVAAAAGLGVLTLAFKAVSDASHELGQKAIDLKKFSETTGLSTNQVQAFQKEASKVGIGSEEAQSSMQKFTVAFEELRHGSGRALDTLRRYRPDIADQMQATEDNAAALNLLAKAYEGLGVSAQNALSKAFFGRGGIDMSRLMQGFDIDASTAAFRESGRGLSPQQVENLKRLETENQQLRRNLSEGFAKMFAEDVLAAEKKFLTTLIEINNELKNVKLPTELLKQLLALGPTAAITFPAAVGAAHLFGGGGNAPGAGNETVGADLAGLPSTTPSMAGQGKLLLDAQLANQQKLVAVLGDQATVLDLVKQKELQLQAARAEGSAEQKKRIDEVKDALMAQAQFQAEMAQQPEGAPQRRLEALQQEKALYPELTAAQARQMSALVDQKEIASAITGEQRLQAQEQATINALYHDGATLEQAMVIAGKQRAIAQAQINAGAQQQLIALQGQAAVASARTTDERLAAQEIATANNLMRQGVSEELAMAVAAQERANAEAQINVAFEKQLAMAQAVTGLQKIMVMDWREAAVAIAEANSNLERQTNSLRQQNELTMARARGNEEAVAAAQAYANAINSGADAEHASANAAQVRLKYQLQINEQIFQEQQARQAAAAAEQEQLNLDLARKDSTGSTGTPDVVQGVSGQLGQMIKQLQDLGNHAFDQWLTTVVAPLDLIPLGQMIAEALARAQREQPAKDKAKQAQDQAQQDAQQAQQTAQQKQQSIADQIQQLQNQRTLAEAGKISPEAAAQVQAQQAYAKAIADGATAAQAQQIADLTLANALADNTGAVQSNTEALSPYYATDPRLSHLGFRAGSSALGYDPFAQAAAGAAGPAALPFGSTVGTGGLPSVPSPSIAPSEPAGHWAGGGPTAIYWVGSGPPNYNDPTYRNLTMTASALPPRRQQSTYSAPQPSGGWNPNGVETGSALPPRRIPYNGPATVPPGGWNPNGVETGSARQANVLGGAWSLSDLQKGRVQPITVVQNFNAPVDRGVAAEMKTTAYQAAQAGMRSLRAVR